MSQVELHPAFEWTCESCGKSQFERAVAREFSPEETEELRDAYGIQPWEEGDFLMAPKSVKCASCGEAFQVGFGERP